jgi:hypothetical protein
MWCIPALTALFRERMDDILALYTEPLHPGHQLHCFDEASKQLLTTPRGSQVMKHGEHGHDTRTDYEYKRHGTRNLFVAVAPFLGTRTVTVTPRRTAELTAAFLWQYCMETHGSAAHIHLVLDNLNTHKEKSLQKIWGQRKTKKFFRHVTMHFTPPHASWLNMAEIEIGCVRRQGVRHRLGNEEVLKETVAGIVQIRNDRRATISWSFTKTKAREKFPTLYDSVKN